MRASAVLSAEAKLVWMEDWALDHGGEGCWLSHEQLGERLGMTANAVQLHRTRLADLGLYERLKRPGARSPGWRARIPEQCRLRTQRPSPIEVAKARTFLDLALRGKPVTGTVSPPGGDGLNPSRPRSQPVPATVSRPPSTALDFDSGVPVKQVSTALSLKGNRVSARAPESKAIEGDLPQSVLPSSSSSDSEIEPESRLIDLKPADQVTDEGFAELRRKREAYRAAAEEERKRKQC